MVIKWAQLGEPESEENECLFLPLGAVNRNEFIPSTESDVVRDPVLDSADD